MKKFLLVLLSFVFMFSLMACNRKPQEVLDVEALINAIGEVSVTSGEAISKAEKEYSYLSPENQALVSNHSALLRAKDEYDEDINKLLIGEWAYSYVADKNDISGITHFSKGDKLCKTFTFLEGGVGEYKYYNETTEHTISSGTIDWLLQNNKIIVSLSFVSGVQSDENMTIDFVNKTITDLDNNVFHKFS